MLTMPPKLVLGAKKAATTATRHSIRVAVVAARGAFLWLTQRAYAHDVGARAIQSQILRWISVLSVGAVAGRTSGCLPRPEDCSVRYRVTGKTQQLNGKTEMNAETREKLLAIDAVSAFMGQPSPSGKTPVY